MSNEGQGTAETIMYGNARPNCYLLRADQAGRAQLSCGLPVRGIYNRYVGLLDRGLPVPIAEEVELAQVAANRWEDLTEAMLGGGEGTFGRNAPGFVPRGSFQGTILLVWVTPGMLCNDGMSKPHVKQGRFWVGAEGPDIKTVHQVGAHQDSYKAQLFQLEPGQFVFFCDSAYEVTVITAGQAGEEPTRRRATPEELADHVLNTARQKGDNRQALQWCFYTLRALDCQAQLSSFRQLYPHVTRR